VTDIKADAIRELVAPVVAFLRHDIARPDSPVQMDPTWAERQLSQVLDMLNDAPPLDVEHVEPPVRELLDLVQESLQRRD
jgi:hypothetical protein